MVSGCSTTETQPRHTSDVRRERLARILYVALLAAVVTGALGCEKIGEAGDNIRRSTERSWDQGRRRLGGLADTAFGERR